MKYLKLLRAHNWIKNVFILFPLVFSLRLFDTAALADAAIACIIFCFASSIIYIINDLKDIESDKLHPRKKNRPLASGAITPAFALITIIVLLLVVVAFMLITPVSVAIPILIYLVLNLAYIYKLKTVFLIDAIIIASNFILRILIGCYAISVMPSNWILVVTFFMALLLTFIKRKSEIVVLGDHAQEHRAVLKHYTLPLLDTYIFISATITIAAYILYTIDLQVIEAFKTDKLLYSALFVIVGVFRFLFLSNSSKYKGEGDPTTLILKDVYLQVTFALWGMYIVSLIYFLH